MLNSIAQKFDDCEVQLLEVLPQGFHCKQYVFFFEWLMCRANGMSCIVRADQQVMSNPPPIGSRITVKHAGYFANKRLKQAVFWRDSKFDNSPTAQSTVIYCAVLTRIQTFTDAVWTKNENHKPFFDYSFKQLECKSMDDWYKVTKLDFERNGGMALLNVYYEGSILRAVQSIYPEHNWTPWKFARVSNGFWDSKKNQQDLIDWLTETLHIKTLDDWYRVSLEQIARFVSPTSIKNAQQLAQVLQELYPTHTWDVEKLTTRKGPIKAAQRLLTAMVRELFPTAGLPFLSVSKFHSSVRGARRNPIWFNF